MPALALTLLALYGTLAVGVRMAVQVRRTGASGFKGLHDASRAERAGGLLFAIAIALFPAGLALELAGVLSPISALDGPLGELLGVLLAAIGVATTLAAQLAMGDAWRIGVDPSEHTELVTTGPFAIVRNPIYAAMIPSFTGIALLAPNLLTILGVALLIAALELQTRLVEEPYLLRLHGERYALYASRVGRLFPGVGRLARRPA
jgi:protein-S-isoprenylcysteine O-methyltransferase Ste14